jgi:hypothetical protein
MDKGKTGQLLADIRRLERKYNLKHKEILDILEKKETNIPISIFNKKLGSLESIVKYLKENLKLSYKEIAFLLNRKQQPIRTTYIRSKHKYPSKLDISSKERIPVSVLENNELSVLESIVSYFLKQKYTVNQISSILHRNYKTIWTIKRKL